MRAYDLIMKTRRGEPLTGAEIREFEKAFF